MRLTSHFTVAELCRSQTANRNGLNNWPTTNVVERLGLVAVHILEPIRAAFNTPFSPSSGYRSATLNRLLGSSEGSQHVRGEAVDLELPGVSNLRLAHWIREHLVFDQLILECYRPDVPSSGWVHCSFSGDRARGQVLTYSGGQYFNGLLS
ncbi:D-Ala-D-Ala carboxypeptidase family metallohydrolase [Sneathiella limimaris]|uniref:D-Ala-D-Ala carboxypeptidase family metallohydrolase n=1 Tax=Sneathiella limimaris TaxID=1964213 RepID=UPI00146EF7FD|nr:D-Ala-D-Ala carboxypeptidase family metallohydrolase [Sneathiella limimaris]